MPLERTRLSLCRDSIGTVGIVISTSDKALRLTALVLSERDSSHAMFWCFVFRSCFVYLAQCLPIYTLRLSPDSPALGLVVLVQQVMSPALRLRSRPDRW